MPNRIIIPASTRFSLETLWTPEQLTLEGWWDASDASTITTATGVSQWDDKSGNGHHATQGSGGSQPTTGTRNIGGLNVLDFDGSNDFFNVTNNPTEFIGEIWGVWLLDNNATNNKLFGGSGNNQVGVPQNTDKLRLWRGANPYNNDTQSSTLITYGQPYFTGWLGHTDTKKFSVNGTVQTTTDVYDGDPVGFNLQKIGDGDYSPRWDGVMAEILLLPNALSLATSDHEKVEGYLSHKWGLTANLPIAHPYKNVPPTV